MKINDLYASAYQQAIEETAAVIYVILDIKFTYKRDFLKLEKFADYFGLEFDENGYIIPH